MEHVEAAAAHGIAHARHLGFQAGISSWVKEALKSW